MRTECGFQGPARGICSSQHIFSPASSDHVDLMRVQFRIEKHLQGPNLCFNNDLKEEGWALTWGINIFTVSLQCFHVLSHLLLTLFAVIVTGIIIIIFH